MLSAFSMWGCMPSFLSNRAPESFSAVLFSNLLAFQAMNHLWICFTRICFILLIQKLFIIIPFLHELFNIPYESSFDPKQHCRKKAEMEGEDTSNQCCIRFAWVQSISKATLARQMDKKRFWHHNAGRGKDYSLSPTGKENDDRYHMKETQQKRSLIQRYFSQFSLQEFPRLYFLYPSTNGKLSLFVYDSTNIHTFTPETPVMDKSLKNVWKVYQAWISFGSHSDVTQTSPNAMSIFLNNEYVRVLYILDQSEIEFSLRDEKDWNVLTEWNKFILQYFTHVL